MCKRFIGKLCAAAANTANNNVIKSVPVLKAKIWIYGFNLHTKGDCWLEVAWGKRVEAWERHPLRKEQFVIAVTYQLRVHGSVREGTHTHLLFVLYSGKLQERFPWILNTSILAKLMHYWAKNQKLLVCDFWEFRTYYSAMCMDQKFKN